ncbi:hypothetical protein B0H12DRAFT_101770 [Mycena haematopus]|nr:hypothetical protein B0H12DRAFT_101770 [Mycena haematopus]
MPVRPSQDFDTMTTKPALASKRSWLFNEAVPRASSSSSSASSSSSVYTNESANARSVVPGILSALAPTHAPQRRPSPAPPQQSWRNSHTPTLESQHHLFVASPSPRSLSPYYASHDPRRLGRTSPTPSMPGVPESRGRSPVQPPYASPSSPLHLNTSHHRESPQSVSAPAPRSPHYLKASPTWNATATFAPPTTTPGGRGRQRPHPRRRA